MLNKKCAAGAGTPNSAVIKTVAEPIRKSYKNILSQQQMENKLLIDLLPHGKAHAVSMAHLANILGCSERDVRKFMYRARCDGAIICGDSNGYYLPETREELIRWYRLAKKRALSSLKALKTARQQLRELEGQQNIEI